MVAVIHCEQGRKCLGLRSFTGECLVVSLTNEDFEWMNAA